MTCLCSRKWLTKKLILQKYLNFSNKMSLKSINSIITFCCWQMTFKHFKRLSIRCISQFKNSKRLIKMFYSGKRVLIVYHVIRVKMDLRRCSRLKDMMESFISQVASKKGLKQMIQEAMCNQKLLLMWVIQVKLSLQWIMSIKDLI